MNIIYSQAHLSATWHVARPSPATTAQLAHAAADDLALLQMRARGLAGAFSAQEQAEGCGLLFGVMFMTQGGQSIRMNRSSVALAAGDVAIWRSDVSCDFETHEGVEKLQVLIPGEIMHQHWPCLVPDSAHLEVKAHSALTALSRGFLESLWRQKDYLSPAELHAAIHAAIDLLEKGQHIAPARSRHPDRLTPILQFLDEALADPALSPSTIAQQFGYSLRSLHALFARHGKTVSCEIRERRLERCRLALTSLNPEASISDLAMRWGFLDASHFSKLFKARYGMGPRAYRGRGRPSEKGSS